MAQAMVLEAVQIRQLLPVRPRFSHKGDFGRVLLVCGSVGFTGAAALAARAALRTGAGLITVATPRQVWPIVAAKLDEPMVMPMAEDKAGRLSLQAAPALVQLLAKADACLIGPGLGRSEELDALVAALVGEARCPVVLDADGINAMAGHIDRLREAACPLILTPHDGEFLRLSPGAALPPADFDTRADRAMMLARRLGAVVLLKGYRTAITDGTRLYRNETGNPGMATGGSGDVLAGMLVSLLGQGLAPLEAAAAAAWLHGAAGDRCAAERGEYGMTPSDLIDAASRLLP
ncbi:MAG: NAD(P)H-hydrate dehydratase [Oscillospiraceae bacterium]|nr:NAD(P)H-hydrate dehydratase [Oscillospiraceae bacterium]